MFLEHAAEGSQAFDGAWPEALADQHGQDFDDQQVSDLRLGTDAHHRVFRHRGAKDDVGAIRQGRIRLSQGDDRGPL